MTRDRRTDDHLSEDAIAAYVTGALRTARRAAAEDHLADCDECRATVVAVDAVLRPRARRLTWMAPLAIAAAAALAVLAVPTVWIPVEEIASHRAPATDIATGPRGLSPRGTIDIRPVFTWTAAPNAEIYRVRLLDGGGSVVWEATSADTVVALPDTVALRGSQDYFWQVRAGVGIDRWVNSEFVEFSVTKDHGPR